MATGVSTLLKHGLKTQISIILFVLLLLGMLLINVVVTFFWQHSLIQEKKNHIERIVNLWERGHDEKRNNSLDILQQSMGGECVEIVLYRGAPIEVITPLPGIDINDVLMRSFSEKKARATLAGISWHNFTFSHRYLVSVHCLGPDFGKYCIGIIVDLNQVYAQVRAKQPMILGYILLNSIILATIGFFRIAMKVLKPIDKLITISESYTDTGDFLFSSHWHGDEFGKLSFALNSMLGKIHADREELKKNIHSLQIANEQLRESEGKVVRAEKLAAVGRLSAGLAHEIGNPIGIVQGYLELLKKKDLTTEERIQFTERGTKELERINTMVRKLLDFSRTSRREKSSVSASAVCSEALQSILTQERAVKVEFLTNFYDGPDEVVISSDDFYQVLINCLFNSIDAIKDRGRINNNKIAISTEPVSDGRVQKVRVLLRDNGVGVPKSLLSSVFDPFFTTKDVGKGTGLGLSVSIAIIEAAGGVMEIESNEGEGTEVSITLPVK